MSWRIGGSRRRTSGVGCVRVNRARVCLCVRIDARGEIIVIRAVNDIARVHVPCLSAILRRRVGE